ncbi:MAG TPA: M20/M25/M40 family metallo-hydrolase, partial [Candidatus Sulfopaludibacter sp.]|nr:M20/M25/M40 family metallo-hydrolase [Candidatus Sulfopaludibacter sp.]
FGEPSGIDNITISYKGRLEIRILCDVNSGAHASAPWISLNAIEEIYSIWANLKKVLDSYDINKSKNKADLVSYSVTEISGGSSHNVTPQKCRMTIDIRIPAHLSCDDILNLIDITINKIRKDKDAIVIKYQVEDKTEPFQANASSTLVRSLVLSILDNRKKRPLLLKKTGTGDMNILGNVLKIPVVTYGPGDPHSSHTVDEKIYIHEYLKGIEIYKNTLFHMIRLHKTLQIR